MSQFSVYRNPAAKRSPALYLLDVQSGLLDDLATRVVVPLIRIRQIKPIRYLNPVFEIEGRKVVMSTAELAGVPRAALGPKVCSLERERAAIIGALDFLITGI